MLTDSFNDLSLAERVVGREQFRPYPRIDERGPWRRLPAKLRKERIADAEGYLGYEFPALPATRYLEYTRTGNRTNFETLHHKRRIALSTLIIGECIENEGRFVDDIVNGIWCICEESSWAYPAHNGVGVERRRLPLPDTDRPVFDLFAGETAALLAFAYYLLGDRLEAVTGLVPKRIVSEIDRRIITPYLHDEFHWMGFLAGRAPNNWNPWCNSNALAATLLTEADSERRVAVVRRALMSIDRFLRGYGKDGGCDEGPSYWGHAGASLFDCLELLRDGTGGYIDVYDEPMIAEIGRYIYRMHIDGDYFVNFADANARLDVPSDLVFRYANRIDDRDMSAFAAHFQQNPGPKRNARISLLREIPALFNRKALDQAPAALPYVGDAFFPSIEVMTAREQEGSPRGLFLAAKGGHNGESHNHNDVGHFIVFRDGKPVLIDVGVETYRRKTFSPERYEIWTMQSAYHNLPTINGVMQDPGADHAAKNVEYRCEDREVSFALNLEDAYPEKSPVRVWRRELRFVRTPQAQPSGAAQGAQEEPSTTSGTSGGSRIELIDSFTLSSAKPIVWSFMAHECPQISDERTLRFEHAGATLTCDTDLEVQIDTLPIEDQRLLPVWGDRLYRIRFEGKPGAEQTVRFSIT